MPGFGEAVVKFWDVKQDRSMQLTAIQNTIMVGAAVHSRHVVPLLAVVLGRDGLPRAVVMELAECSMHYMANEPLRRCDGSKPKTDMYLPLAVVMNLLADAMEGVAALHDVYLLHRDFKTENILVGGRRLQWYRRCLLLNSCMRPFRSARTRGLPTSTVL